MKIKKFNIYLDGASIRLSNRLVSFTQKDGETVLLFRNVDGEPNKPACLHETLKGKVRQTLVKLSDEAMEALVISYIEYKKSLQSKKLK